MNDIGSASRGAGASEQKKNDQILTHLGRIMEGDTAGDPCSGQRWTRRTTQAVASALQAKGITAARCAEYSMHWATLYASTTRNWLELPIQTVTGSLIVLLNCGREP